MSLARVLAEVARERQQQDAKWGEQNHPDGTGPDWRVTGMSSTWILEAVRKALADSGRPTYRIRFGNGDPHHVGADAYEVARIHGAEIEEIPPAGATWLLIAAEEAFEAFVETDPAKLRAELVQLSAVAVAWIEAIDRRESGHSTEPDPDALPCGHSLDRVENDEVASDEHDRLCLATEFDGPRCGHGAGTDCECNGNDQPVLCDPWCPGCGHPIHERAAGHSTEDGAPR